MRLAVRFRSLMAHCARSTRWTEWRGVERKRERWIGIRGVGRGNNGRRTAVRIPFFIIFNSARFGKSLIRIPFSFSLRRFSRERKRDERWWWKHRTNVYGRKIPIDSLFLDVSIYFDWDLEKSGIKCFSGSTMDRGKEKRDRNVSVMKNIDRIRYFYI